jgi:hypothetical protein
MTRPDGAKARACAGMRAGRARARAALLTLRRMPRGCLEVRGGFGYNLAGRATIFFWFLTDGQLYGPGEIKKERGRGESRGNHIPCVA